MAGTTPGIPLHSNWKLFLTDKPERMDGNAQFRCVLQPGPYLVISLPALPLPLKSAVQTTAPFTHHSCTLHCLTVGLPSSISLISSSYRFQPASKEYVRHPEYPNRCGPAPAMCTSCQSQSTIYAHTHPPLLPNFTPSASARYSGYLAARLRERFRP